MELKLQSPTLAAVARSSSSAGTLFAATKSEWAGARFRGRNFGARRPLASAIGADYYCGR
jgi:hypothetical protein